MKPSESALIVPKGMKELAWPVDNTIPVLAYAFKRKAEENWSLSHSHTCGQLIALRKGLVTVEAGAARWMFPSPRCVWIPPGYEHCGRSLGSAAGAMVYLSAPACRGLATRPCVFGLSQLLFSVVYRMAAWCPSQDVNAAQKHLIAVLRDEIRRPHHERFHLPMPRDERLARVSHTFLQDVADNRTLDDWAGCANMARRTFMRAFSAEVGMTFGQWRRQARLLAALEMLADGEPVTNAAVAVGYDSVSAFINMFRTVMGSTPQQYLRSQRDPYAREESK